MNKKEWINKKYILQIGYIILLTLYFPFQLLCIEWGTEFGAKYYVILVLIYFIFALVLAIMNIVCSFQKYRQKDIMYCINSMLILKYGLVCSFILNFLIIIFLTFVAGLFALIASRGLVIFALPVILPWYIIVLFIFICVTWLGLLPGAFYGLQVIRMGILEKRLKKITAWIHIILQFMFIVDVLDAMYLSVKKWNIGKKSAMTIGIIYCLSIVGSIYLGIKFL